MNQSYTDAVRIHPRVGSGYDGGIMTGTRLLVVGESQYNWDGSPDFTAEIVSEHIDEGYTFFNVVQKVVTGQDLIATRDDRAKFWDSVAFYNFVQHNVGDGPRQRPTARMFADSVGAFREVIGVLNPTHVLVVGWTMWKHHMPKFDSGPIQTWEAGGRTAEAGWYTERGQNALALGIVHPAGALAYDTWVPIVEDFLNLT